MTKPYGDSDQLLYDPPAVRSGGSRPGSGFYITSIVLTIVSIITIAFGWWRMYSYDEYTDKIVGGDAYNFGIIATRGAGIITAGVGIGVIAVVFAVLAVAQKLER